MTIKHQASGATGLVSTLLGVADCDFIKGGDGKQAKGNVFNLLHTGESLKCCPKCQGAMHRHGERVLRVTDTPNGAEPTVLAIHIPRYRCTSCGHIEQPKVQGVNEEHHMTERAVLAIAKRGLETTFRSISGDYGISHETAKKILTKYLDDHEDRMIFATPTFLGIDEIKIRGLGEVTVITDLEHRTLFDLLLGRNQKQLTAYFGKLKGREGVQWVCSDMYRPFEKSIATSLPNAKWVIDRFHVVMKANEAVDYVRRKVQQSLPAKVRVKTKHGLAYTLRKRQKDLSPEESSQLLILRRSQTTPTNETNKKLSKLITAFDLKEDFANIFEEPSKADANAAFVAWEASIPKDRVFTKFRELAKTFRRFQVQILNRWDCPIALTNGYTECANRLIRECNMKGRGYSFKILRARMLFRSANLEKIALNGGLTYGPLLTGKSQFGEGLLSEASTEDEDWIIGDGDSGDADDLPEVKEPEDVPY